MPVMTIVRRLRGSLMVHRAVFAGDASVRVLAPPAPAKRAKRDDHYMDGQNRRSDRDEMTAKSLHQSQIISILSVLVRTCQTNSGG